MSSTWIPANIAAVRLRLSREAVVRRVQRGVLQGQFTSDGFWVVDSADIKRFIRERDHLTAAADAAEPTKGTPA